MLDLSKLNPPQREAVKTIEGPLLVLAGAGSGKTRVIVHRVGYMLEQGIKPTNILAVTFTNKAAAEMRERVAQIVGRIDAKKLTVSTFHAFGVDVLRRFIDRLGYPKKFAIADASDQISIVKRAMREVKIDDRKFDPKRVLALISKAKCAGGAPEPKPEGMGDDYDLITAEVYPRYQLALQAQGTVDFDDLILMPAQLMREHEEVQKSLLNRYRYLLVDEYQDTNKAQFSLLKLLAGERNNVCVVGDDDQSIYAWRGAEVENILRFDRFFPGVKEVALEQNYRSSQSILDAANAVIAKNPERKVKRLWTDRGSGENLKVVVCPNEEEEGMYIGRECTRLLKEGHRPQDIAILYRTNLQSRAVEEALRAEGISYEVVGGTEFFDRREVKDLIAYMKAIDNPQDEVSLLRVINEPPRGIGDMTITRLSARAREMGIPLEEALRRAEEFPELPNGAGRKVVEFLALMERYRARFEVEPLWECAGALVDEIGLKEAARASVVSAAAAGRKMGAIDSLVQSLQRYCEKDAEATLDGWLKRVALDTRSEEGPGESNSVTLMTLHASKGLEWPIVFLCGMEEDLLPHSGIAGEPQNLEEERRLAYVGITRARERLFLTRANSRMKRGKAVERTPSRFLEDIPEELIDKVDLTSQTPQEKGKQEVDFFASLRNKLKQAPPQPALPGPAPALPGPPLALSADTGPVRKE